MSLEVILEKKELERVNEAKNFVTRMLERVTSFEVRDEADFSELTCAYKESRDLRDMIDVAKKMKVAPHKKAIEEANDIAKGLIDKLDQVEEVVKAKTATYLKAREQTLQNDQKQVKFERSLLGDNSPTLPEIVESRATGEAAIAYLAKEKRYKVTSINEVPRQYLILNDPLIKQNIKLGVDEIPGIEIYEEEILKMRTR